MLKNINSIRLGVFEIVVREITTLLLFKDIFRSVIAGFYFIYWTPLIFLFILIIPMMLGLLDNIKNDYTISN